MSAFEGKADSVGVAAMSAFDGGLKGSTQHFIFEGKDGV